ncbi:hypothetical protein E4T38_07876 [Aureobasidium subglaciale]|nr:hypothetical protein E4T38_07876 [Aureobasidium subglaciale]KAI5216564.1 hypothetical protein E4T40_07886 [Aureobasidium subglaciale]KAI5219785.1 hypothetical protein E4T41_07801 [Aureobasidium subglaciale]KAI5257704.1 hypothetical protein E4T46_07777 [Aureobasidium subglaciale]
MAEQQNKPLHELLSHDMVDIYVGPENNKWTLHEKLLCYRSKFFRNIFYSKENKNRQFGLPDEEDEPFRLFVGWLYSAHTPTPKEEKDLTVLLDLYLMAEKWEIRDLTLEVLKSVRNWYKESNTYPALRRVQYIYANTDLESPMRQLLISSVARNLVTSESGMPPQWDKALRKNGQLAVDIIIAMQKWNLEKESIPDPRQDSVKPILEDSEQARAEKKEGKQDEDQNSEENNDDAEEGEQDEAEQEEGEDNEEGEEGEQEPEESQE